MASSPSFSWERIGQSATNSNGSFDRVGSRKDDLLVFGYSCKLYRDEEKLRRINSGQYLIPWMGDEKLLIDRYDVRGYLNDLSLYDSNSFHSMQPLNAEEEELERLLNRERFADLCNEQNNLQSEQLQEDEKDLFRDGDQRGEFSQVAYQYDTEVNNSEPNVEENKNDVFKVPAGLQVPTNIVLPKSNKLHCIIEKTATFVAKQGLQMEILLKTKQATNSSFDFLSIDSELHAYYKTVLSQIQSGKYIPNTEHDSDSSQNSDQSDDDDNNYLHPSLLCSQSAAKHKEKLNISSSLFTSSQDNDSYSQLVKCFKDKFADDIESNGVKESTSESTSELASQSNTLGSSLIPQPPSDVELIIVKLAQHVAKNGENFEVSIKSLQDKKFDFLNKGHIYHAYYVKQKIHYLSQMRKSNRVASTTASTTDSSKSLITFAITSKEASKKNVLANSALAISESSQEWPPPVHQSQEQQQPLSKEKALQEERKKRALEFVKLLRKTNQVDTGDSTLVFGPNLPAPRVQLSPTIEAVTSPIRTEPASPCYQDSTVEQHQDETKDKMTPEQKSSILFRRENSQYSSPVKRSRSSSRRRSSTPSHLSSPHQNYLRTKRSLSPSENSPEIERRKKSKRKHRHRSSSKKHSSKKSRSRSHSRSRRKHRKHSHSHRHRRPRSSSRSVSRSVSSSDSEYHRTRNKSSRHSYRARSRS